MADPLSKSPNSSYGQILRSSSIIGGAQAINYLVGMLRTKIVAVMLGPSGVGLVGLYVSATTLIGVFAGLGITSSGVRQVAEADGSGDVLRTARTVVTLRRACWATGILGWVITAVLSYPLSVWTFGSGERTGGVIVLGATLLLGSISGGQSALLQGTRRIGDLARISVWSMMVGTIMAVCLYGWLGEAGIVPVLVAIAGVNLGCSWWFARRVKLVRVTLEWTETWRNSKRLVVLGFALMWGVLLSAIVALVVRSVIVRELGLEANGIYQAAWAISGMFAGFILGAMATDFYPRLTAVAHDDAQVNRLVNEQTEIGILLALPGLLATLSFAPWIMRAFYSAKFLPGAELLPWFVLGIFGQVLSWPMGYTLAAKGAARWHLFVESLGNLLHVVLSISLLRWLGLWGTALALPILYLVHVALLVWICRRVTGFRWAPAAIKLMAQSAALIAAGFALQRVLPVYPGLVAGFVLTTSGGIFSARGLALRLGPEHRLVSMVCKFPVGKFACGV